MVTPLLVILILLVLGLGGLVIAQSIKIEKVQAEVRSEQVKHNRCHIQTEAALTRLTNQIYATALRHAAEQWDDPANQNHLRRLAREKYSPGGPSMPTIWLREQADKIDPPSTCNEHEHSFEGKCQV